MTCAWLCRPTTISVRGCAAIGVGAVGQVEQVDRPVDDHVGRDDDDRAVVGERGVQRGEGLHLELDRAADVRLDERRLGVRAARRGSSRGRRPAARQGGERRREAAVDEDQLVRVEPGHQCSALQRRRPRQARRRPRRTRPLAIGATFVNRNSSSRVVGKPCARKRAIASSRSVVQPRGRLERSPCVRSNCVR